MFKKNFKIRRTPEDIQSLQIKRLNGFTFNQHFFKTTSALARRDGKPHKLRETV